MKLCAVLCWLALPGLALALAGCPGAAAPPARPQPPLAQRAPVPAAPAPSAGKVHCTATLTRLEPEHPWFDNGAGLDGAPGSDDGVAPLAVFSISKPARYAGRSVGILFKYAGPKQPLPPSAPEVGKVFTFELPVDFLGGDYATIDNLDVRGLRAVP